MDGLLFHPVQYESEELSKNVFYTGTAPNQQAIPAVDYLMGKAGLKAKDVPVEAFSVGEEELCGVDTKPLVGHLAAWN